MPKAHNLVHSTHFSSIYMRRSCETPARAHPREEQDECERMALPANEPDKDSSESADDSTSSAEAIIFSQITEEPIHTDKLICSVDLPIGKVNAALTFLELDGKVKLLPGDFYVRCKLKAKHESMDARLANTVSGFLEFIQERHRGISRRYLQLYLAAYWCYIESSRISPKELLQMCFRSAPKTFAKLKNYVTPLHVQIVSAK
jgi:hypothetical protein